MRIQTTIDAKWLVVVQPASHNWTSQISYFEVASNVSSQSVCAVLMCLYDIATDCNGPLEAAHAHIHDDRYDAVECSAAGQPQ